MAEPARAPDRSPIGTIEEYLAQLRLALSNADPALLQDALYDSEQHLSAELERVPEPERAAALITAIERFGTPAEVAAAWQETERRVSRALTPPPSKLSTAESAVARFFGVIGDGRTYGTLIYLLLAFPTGAAGFIWTMFGLSVSLGFSILIIGVPVFLIFLASIRGLSLLEGRLIELLLGERMPRRPPVPAREGGMLARLKEWVTDGRTWSTIGYFLLKLPLGVLYFSSMLILLTFSGGLIAAPIVRLFTPYAVISLDDYQWTPPFPALLLLSLLGVMILLASLNLLRLLGRMHGAIAKTMLVRP